MFLSYTKYPWHDTVINYRKKAKLSIVEQQNKLLCYSVIKIKIELNSPISLSDIGFAYSMACFENNTQKSMHNTGSFERK